MKAKASRKNSNETMTKSYFSKTYHTDRKEKLACEDWSEAYQAEDPNLIYYLILEKYGKHYHENKTTRTFTKRTNHLGRELWMTAEILTDVRRRDRLARLKNRLLFIIKGHW